MLLHLAGLVLSFNLTSHQKRAQECGDDGGGGVVYDDDDDDDSH